VTSSDAALGDHIKCPSSLQSPVVWLSEYLCHKWVWVRLQCCAISCRLVPVGQFGLVRIYDHSKYMKQTKSE
jgi:hypothetical protein